MCVHDQIRRVERDHDLVASELASLREAGVLDPIEEWFVLNLLTAIEAKADELRRASPPPRSPSSRAASI
jgi:hypothetical protein